MTTDSNQSTPTPAPEVYLAPHHRQMLEQESGITPEVIAARGYRTVTLAEALHYGFSNRQARAGLLLPVHTTDGQTPLYVLRPDQPREVRVKNKTKLIKYEWPQGVGPRLDCPPSCYPHLQDPTIPLWITEGQKKGDALASWNLCVIDLPNGVWGWKSKQTGLLADLDTIAWANRTVYLLFDSDVFTNAGVAAALTRLMTLLKRRKAQVSPVPLPSTDQGKQGVDDFKARGGTLAQLLTLAQLGRYLPLRLPSATPSTTTESKELIEALGQLGYTFRMRALDDLIEVNGQPISDPLRAEIRTRMRDRGYTQVKAIEDAYTAYALLHSFHPVKDYLLNLHWDGGPHIDTLAGHFQDDHADVYQAMMGCHDPAAGQTVFGLWLRRWLLGAVGKVLQRETNPMLALDGPQGCGKSFFVQWLGGVLPDYLIEAPIDPDDKDAWLRLATKFVWEVGELGATTSRSDREALKNFLTTRVVTVRRAYGRDDLVKPALASFIGTINNEAGFLADPTGHRRFLTCRLRAIDWSYQERLDPHQVWAEAVARYRQNELAQLTRPEVARLQAMINEEYLVERPVRLLFWQHFEVKPELDLWTPAMDILARLEFYGLKGNQAENLKQLSALMKQLGVLKSRPRSLPGRPVAYKGVYEVSR